MHRPPSSYLVFSFYLSITFIASVLCEDLSFNFQAFDDQIVLEGDASRLPSHIELTGSNRTQSLTSSVGRAMYHEPLHLWEMSTGTVADFTTKFSFAINSENKELFADGFTFFLAPNGSDMPSNSSGGYLALVSSVRDSFDASTAFVAVEFDTYYNGVTNFWDPQCEHLGIDLNNIESVNYTCVNWFRDKIMSAGLIQVSITYNSSTQNLSVLMIDAANPKSNIAKLSHSVNLTEHLPEWVIVGFSAATGMAFELHTLYSWEFSSNLRVAENVNSTTRASPADTNLGDKVRAKRRKWWVWHTTGLGSFLLLTLVLGFAWFGHRSRKTTNDQMGGENDFLSFDEEFDQVTAPKKFSFRDLAAATNNFADARLLGRGGFGSVYEGCLTGMNTNVAIKKITPESRQGIKEYAAEVKTISRLRHRNLVQLIGWCHEKELLLIYDFMPNGSLDSHLFRHRTFLTWEKRYKIAQGIASALLYLHEEWEQCVVHRDIKSSNIMLDSSFNAKLGDFGLARLIDHAKGSQTTILAGTIGYMAPECFYTGKANKESDVYSFGIVLLEIACGRRVVDSLATEDQVWLLDWVWELYRIGKLLDAVDPKLGIDFDKEQLERLMIVGLWCAHLDSRFRPCIREALALLNFDASPPALPSILPVPSYLAHPPSLASPWLLPSSFATSISGEPVVQ